MIICNQLIYLESLDCLQTFHPFKQSHAVYQKSVSKESPSSPAQYHGWGWLGAGLPGGGGLLCFCFLWEIQTFGRATYPYYHSLQSHPRNYRDSSPSLIRPWSLIGEKSGFLQPLSSATTFRHRGWFWTILPSVRSGKGLCNHLCGILDITRNRSNN